MRHVLALRSAARIVLPCALVLLVACGEDPQSTAAVAADRRGPAAQLVDSQPSLPAEPLFAFADIVTGGGDLDVVWHRFRLAGQPPDVDLDRSSLLFAGFGESGTCPARFDGIEVEGDEVRLLMGSEGGPLCTADYRPRTFVVAVDRDTLPSGAFTLVTEGHGRFVLTGSPQPQPPPASPLVDMLTGESPAVSLVAEPSAVAAGAPVEVAIHNEDPVAVTVGWETVLERWDGQRWLPAVDQPANRNHPAFSGNPNAAAEPAQRAIIGTVDTTGLAPGWYGVRTRLSVSVRGGVVEARAAFEVSGVSAVTTTPASATPCPSGNSRAVIDYAPFLRFDGREYMEVHSGPGEAQFDADDLRERVGETRCKLQDHNGDPSYVPQDGDAAFLPPGTPLHAVAGFDVTFRLAARTSEQVLLFELDSTAGATQGRDLLDIHGRVQAITVNSDEGDGEDVLARITDPAEVDRLVQLVLDAPVEADARPTGVGVAPRYFLEFELMGRPAVARVLFPEDNLLQRGIRVPAAFTAAIVEAVEQ